MKKSFIFGAALMLAGAFGFQSCSQESNPGVPTEAAIDNGTELAAAITGFAKDGVLTLPKNVVELNVAADIDLSQVEIKNASPLTLNVAKGVKLTVAKNLNNISINGDAEGPATIEAKEAVAISGTEEAPIGIANANFIIANNFTLENAVIDASNLSSELITLSEEGNSTKNQDIWPEASTTGASVVNDVVVKNTWIKNLQKSLITEKSSWVVINLTIKNNIIQLANTNSYFIDFYSSTNSAFKNLYMDSNTIYNTKINKSQFVIRFNNASNAIKLFGTNKDPEADRFHWEITNNTLIGLFTNKDFGNNIPNNKCVTNIITNNILFNVYRLQKFIQGSQVRTYSDNYIWSDGTTTIDNTDKTTYCTEANPGFTAPTNALDLTAENGGLNLTPSGDAAKAGDPRWIAAE